MTIIVSILEDADLALAERLTKITEQFRSAIQSDDSIEVDVSGCTGADLRILQIVEATRRQVDRLGGEAKLTGPMDPGFAALLDRAGFTGPTHSFWSQGEILP